MAIPTLRDRLPAFNHTVAKQLPKRVDAFYTSDEYAQWRDEVKLRAGMRCEWVSSDGSKCARKEHRMFADHIVEVKDGGARFDPENGQCLCGRHHTIKTVALKRIREASGHTPQG